jgi:alpha-beta hydrolase superfamily lysophospholipase
MGISLLAFDFAGCGQSEGDNVTLGYREKEDLQLVISYLRGSGAVSTIALWGRSMGAATALLHGHRDHSIAAMILDSPFSSLLQLAHEVIDRVKLRHKPKFIVNSAIKMVRSTILKKTGLDITLLRPIENVSSCHIPAIFVAGTHDAFIPPHHTEDIYTQYAGEKSLIMVPGGHNSQRPAHVVDSVSEFLHQTLCDPAGVGETGSLLTSDRRPLIPHANLTVRADDSVNSHCPIAGCEDLQDDEDGFSLPASDPQRPHNETRLGTPARDVHATNASY